MIANKKYFFFSLFWISFLILAYTPSANAATSVHRIEGHDRYQTAIAASQSGWPDGANDAILAYGENFPDALSAGPLAHKYSAPILLTGSSYLNSDTATELKRLKVKNVYIIGGDAVVSKVVEQQLFVMNIKVVRFAGLDRYETALNVAREVGVGLGVFVTTGLDFPDALSVGPIAAAKGMPIILVPPDDLTPLQKSFLKENEIPASYILKGNSELSDNVVHQFPNYEVIGGADPYERNINLIKRFMSSVDFETIYIATGENFPDALTASAIAQKGQNAIVLLKGNTIPYPVLSFIQSKVISKLNILGGKSIISDSTGATLGKSPAQIVAVTNISDSVDENQKYEPPKTVTVTKTNGLKEEVPVIWSLSSVYTLRSGVYQFEGQIKNYSGYVNLSLTVKPIVLKLDSITEEIIQGDYFSFPSKVDATMSDGSIREFPVTWASSIISLNKVGTYTFQGTVQGLTQKGSLTLKVSEDAMISFLDQNLKAVVGDRVGKDLDETIYKSDVIDLTKLDASGSEITDLTGLEYFTNLKTLYLGNNELVKLTALTKLTNLRTLKLNNSELKDLTAIKGLTSLTYLDISENYIKDFGPLKNFIRLTTLYLEDNVPLTPTPDYTPDYSPVRLYYKNLDSKDFSL